MISACCAVCSYSSVVAPHAQVRAGMLQYTSCATGAHVVRRLDVSFDSDALVDFVEKYGIGMFCFRIHCVPVHLWSDSCAAEWGANWGVRVVLLREATQQEQQQQLGQQEIYMHPSPYSKFVSIAHQTIMPCPPARRPHHIIPTTPSSCEFSLSSEASSSSSSCIFCIVLLPDHRAALRSISSPPSAYLCKPPTAA